MPSRGAPPQAPDPRLLLEYFDDPDIGAGIVQTTSASYALGRSRRVGEVTSFWPTGAPARAHAAGSPLSVWSLSGAVGTQQGHNSLLVFPIASDYFTAPLLPSALIRHKRFTFEGAIRRLGVAGTGVFQFGLQSNAGTPLSSANRTGIVIASSPAVFGGNWHVAYRFTAASPIVQQDLGVGAGDAVWRHAAFKYATGPVARSLVVEFERDVVLTLDSATLDVGDQGGATGAGACMLANHTVAGSESQVCACRFAVEEL